MIKHVVFLAIYKPVAEVDGNTYESILFYPPETSLDRQRKQIGLVQALDQFSKDLGSTESCNFITSANNLSVILRRDELEILLTMQSDHILDNGQQSNTNTNNSNLVIKHNDMIAALETSYIVFQVHCVVTQMMHGLEQVEKRVESMRSFYKKWITSMSIRSAIISGIQSPEMSLHSMRKCTILAADLESKLECSLVMIWNNCLVWSGLTCMQDTRAIFEILANADFAFLWENDAEASSSDGFIIGGESKNGLELKRVHLHGESMGIAAYKVCCVHSVQIRI